MTSSTPRQPLAPREPLFRTVKHQLAEALRQGKWKHGQRIASEPLLAERYGVSIGTIRRAVGELVAENILARTQGSGTFVLSHGSDYMLNVFFRIVDRDGRKELPSPRLIEMRRVRADGPTSKALRLKARARVIELERLLSLGERPVILERMRFPASLVPDLAQRIGTQSDGTVYGFLQAQFGITIVRAEEYITATTVDAREAALLAVPVGTPVLRIERTAFTYKDQPIDFRVRLVASAHHGYLSKLGSA